MSAYQNPRKGTVLRREKAMDLCFFHRSMAFLLAVFYSHDVFSKMADSVLLYKQISPTTVANCCFWAAIFPTIWAFMEAISSFSSIVRFYF